MVALAAQVAMLKKTIIATAVLLTILIGAPIFLHNPRHPPHLRIQFELQLLNDALVHYQARHGELFPCFGYEAMLTHLRKIRPQNVDLEKQFAGYKCNPHNLDDAEMLVLFLSEKLDEIVGGPRSAFFEFSDRRLIDADGDGWYEYTSAEGKSVRYDGKHPSVYSESFCVWITAEPDERQKPNR